MQSSIHPEFQQRDVKRFGYNRSDAQSSFFEHMCKICYHQYHHCFWSYQEHATAHRLQLLSTICNLDQGRSQDLESVCVGGGGLSDV